MSRFSRMKKLSRRERRLISMMGFVLAIAGVLYLYDWYQESKQNLITEIEIQQDSISTFVSKLQDGREPAFYRESAAAMKDEIQQYREKILELPKENDASLLIRSTISDKAEQYDVTINSITSRRARPINEKTGLMELRTYFAFDTELEPLLQFFQSLEQLNYYVVVESVNISARRRIRRGRRAPKTLPLNGHAVLRTLFLPNAEASLDRYYDESGGDPPSSTVPANTDERAADKRQPPASKTGQDDLGERPVETGDDGFTQDEPRDPGEMIEIDPRELAKRPIPDLPKPFSVKDPNAEDEIEQNEEERASRAQRARDAGRPVTVNPVNNPSSTNRQGANQNDKKNQLEPEPEPVSGAATGGRRRFQQAPGASL